MPVQTLSFNVKFPAISDPHNVFVEAFSSNGKAIKSLAQGRF